jgi:hypothetical protein
MKAKNFKSFIGESDENNYSISSLLLYGGEPIDPEMWRGEYGELASLGQIAEYLGCPINNIIGNDESVWFDNYGDDGEVFKFTPNSVIKPDIKSSNIFWVFGVLKIDEGNFKCVYETDQYSWAKIDWDSLDVEEYRFYLSEQSLSRAVNFKFKEEDQFLKDLNLLNFGDNEFDSVFSGDTE